MEHSSTQAKALVDLSSSSQIVLTNWNQNPVKQTIFILSQPPHCILTRTGAQKMTSPFSHWLHWFLHTLDKTLRMKKDANKHWGDVYSSTDSTKQDSLLPCDALRKLTEWAVWECWSSLGFCSYFNIRIHTRPKNGQPFLTNSAT